VGLPHPNIVRGLLAFTPSGETGGFAVELIRAAAAAVGLEVEFRSIRVGDDPLPLLESGALDAVCPLSVTDARMEVVAFSGPLLVARGAIFSREGDGPAPDAAALSNAVVTVARHGVGHQWCLERDIPVVVVPSLHGALEKVVDKQARYCVTTQIAGRVDVEERGIQGLVDHPLADERISRAFALAVRKSDPELLLDLNKGLAIVRDDGRWDQLYDKWVARYQPRPRRPYMTREVALWGGGILFTLMSAGLVSQWMLRRKISSRTNELRQSEAMYRAIAESLPALVYTYFVGHDGSREQRYLSPQYAQWQRLFPGLAPGGEWRSYCERIHPDDLQAFETAAMQASAKTSRFDHECRLRAGDGSYRCLHMLLTPFPAENGTVWQGLVLDVTPLRETEQALRASEGKYRVIFERSQDALLLLDPRTLAIRSVNEAACRLYDHAREELVGASLSLVDGLGTLGPELIAEVSGGQPRVGIRATHLRRGGERVEVEVCVAAMVLESETLVLAEVRDVSERMRLEAQLFQAQKLEGLGVLAGGIAHDFNNLMGGILGNVELARAHLDDAPRARGYLGAAEGATQRAADLTQQLLAYAGKARLTEERIDLGALAREMVGLVGTTLHRRAAIRFELAPRSPLIVGDPTLVRQVVMNLITNASDSLAPEGGEIVVRSGTRRFEREYLSRAYVPADIPEADYAFLEIEDNGSGMDERTLSLIFDPFFTTKFTGRGLGLSVVFKTMQRHRGAVKVSSQPGRGTCFQLLFPPAQPAVEAPAPEAASPAGSGRLRVLVVDDEPMVREVVRTILEGRGWSVSMAANGEEALRLQRELQAFDLVLLDLTMPGLSGAATLNGLRKLDAHVKVVLMSGFEASPAADGADARADGFLRKPFSSAKLVKALEGVLQVPGRSA